MTTTTQLEALASAMGEASGRLSQRVDAVETRAMADGEAVVELLLGLEKRLEALVARLEILERRLPPERPLLTVIDHDAAD